MKTKYITGIILATVLTACNDFLEAPTKSSLDESVIYSTPGLARGAVDGIKVPFAETNSYRGRFLPWYGMNTDSEWYNTSQTVGDNSDLAVYNSKPNNTNMNTENNAWAMMYAGIERANLCIRGIRTYGSPETNPAMGELLAESLTLRAVYYADLLKAWGDVPARFEPITAETMYLGKASRDIIYKQLLDDLDEAAELAPWPNESATTATVEYVNKAFVKGFRARLALVAAGYSQYPEGIRRGEIPGYTTQELYQLALNESEDVIESGKAQLESSFETLWRKYNEDNVAAGGESLWEIPFADGRGRMLFTFAVRHNSNDQHHANGANRGGVAGPLPHVFYDFDEKDTRRDVTCVPYRYGNAVSGWAQQELVDLNTWYFGKYRYEWMNRFVTSTNDDGVNKMYMRYAEVLLMAAEAANELGNQGAAKNYLKQIRRRAFPSSEHAVKVDAYVDALNSKESLFNAIVDEHKFEFTGEFERKQALIRWNLLGSKMEEAKTKMFALRDRTGSYATVPTSLYFQIAADNESLQIYGLNRGETTPPAGWTEKTWTNMGTGNGEVKINSLFTNHPDTKQFWPIWQIFLDGSNGKLTNDYGY
ncbi:MAG: RagB/SusD family nutrient uptake outer membrane protein [Cyclobacteriaceae bacterium]|nr:RagB/SusD family nutrient uptake outer membrane protein [Cyclobacteriaceae bacterium]